MVKRLLAGEHKKKGPKLPDPIRDALKNRQSAGGLMSTVTPNSAKVLKYEVPVPLNLRLARPRPILVDFTETRTPRKGSPGKGGGQSPQANRKSLLYQVRPRSRNEAIEVFSPKSTSSAKFELHLMKASGEPKKKVNFSRTQLIMPSADPVCRLVKSPRDDRS